MKKTTYYQINSVIKTFAVIEALVSDKEVELAALSKRLRMPKTTVHRILLTLGSLGYIKQNPNNTKYLASIKFFEIGRQVVGKMNFMEVAHPYMVQLSIDTGETTNLGILDGLDVICVAKMESRHQLKLDQPIGARHRSYCTAFGKALLAFLPKEERSRLLEKETFIRFTPNTLKSAAAVEEEMEIVREQEYAIDNEEGAKGVCCVGAPIFDDKGKAVAGISIAGPTLRITKKDLLAFSRLVKKAAASVSHALGAPRCHATN